MQQSEQRQKGSAMKTKHLEWSVSLALNAGQGALTGRSTPQLANLLALNASQGALAGRSTPKWQHYWH